MRYAKALWKQISVYHMNERKWYLIILIHIPLINGPINQFLSLLAIWISSMNRLFISFGHFLTRKKNSIFFKRYFTSICFLTGYN